MAKFANGARVMVADRTGAYSIPATVIDQGGAFYASHPTRQAVETLGYSRYESDMREATPDEIQRFHF